MIFQEIVLNINADVAEFCNTSSFEDVLAVGTYQLDKATRQRHGRLHVYRLASCSSSSDLRHPTLQLAATLDLPGIFDLQWVQLPSIYDKPCVGLALADGSVQLLAVDAASVGACKTQSGHVNGTQTSVSSTDFQAHECQQGVQLQHLSSCQAVSEGMALSLDWSVQQQQVPALAAVSSSSGAVAILQAKSTGLSPLVEWRGHELEVWMASWDKHQPNVLYSGADDSTFKAWDIRCAAAASSTPVSADQEEVREPVALFSNRRAHAAGVCCISSHPRREHVLVTGSYDEAARLWDVRMLQRPVETCKVSTGGGVWRLKWHPRNDNLLLAACMYNGFALLEVDDSWSQLRVVEEYKGHESIAYGADWYKGQWLEQPAAQTEASSSGLCDPASASASDATTEMLDSLRLGAQHQEQHQDQQKSCYRDIVATCSFYDRRLHLWSPGHTA